MRCRKRQCVRVPHPIRPATRSDRPLSGAVLDVCLDLSRKTTGPDPGRGLARPSMIGREGLVGVAAAFGATHSPHACLCQAEGQALSMSAGELREAAQSSPSLAGLLGRYLYFLTIQTAQTAYANASLNVEARLARWVLMTHDRADGFELSLTHDFLASMLGVRRPGVTTATHVLEGAGMIRAERGRITVLDRAKLEEMADDAYGVAEAEYERLIGRP